MRETAHETALPRALRDPEEQLLRRTMLGLPHVAPLASFVQRLRDQDRGSVPNFDPLDGGVDARVLFVMEKPGPMTDGDAPTARRGSGFISRDNDDPTAEATFRFMQEAGIARNDALLWNAVPWWNGVRKITRAELIDGATVTGELIGLLPDLRVIVLVGARARRLQRRIEDLGYPIVISDHPSPIMRATRLERWQAIPEAWRQIASFL